jgi:hypothetical protein
VLEQIFNLKNLRRYSPKSGQMAQCTQKIHHVPEKFYTGLNGRITPFPVSLLVQVRFVLVFVIRVCLLQHTSSIREIRAVYISKMYIKCNQYIISGVLSVGVSVVSNEPCD